MTLLFECQSQAQWPCQCGGTLTEVRLALGRACPFLAGQVEREVEAGLARGQASLMQQHQELGQGQVWWQGLACYGHKQETHSITNCPNCESELTDINLIISLINKKEQNWHDTSNNVPS